MQIHKFDFGHYLNLFEHKVIIAAVEAGVIGTQMNLPIHENKLQQHQLRHLIGTRFLYNKPMIISYYEVQKRSTELMRIAVKVNAFCDTIKGTNVSFNSIKIEHIAQFCPELLECFSHFKSIIVANRFEVKDGN